MSPAAAGHMRTLFWSQPVSIEPSFDALLGSTQPILGHISENCKEIIRIECALYMDELCKARE